MKPTGRQRTDGSGEAEGVGLEALDPEPDDAEISINERDEPALDSPGDDALLEQEELYEGISSEELPSKKREKL